jgi:hypothetical protein
MKGFLIKMTFGLYHKLEAYADDNEISISGAIRFILTQFFKEKEKEKK